MFAAKGSHATFSDADASEQAKSLSGQDFMLFMVQLLHMVILLVAHRFLTL